jgi:hypothetical protein
MVLVINLSIAAYVGNPATNPGNAARVVLLLIERQLKPVFPFQPLGLPKPLLHLFVKVLLQISSVLTVVSVVTHPTTVGNYIQRSVPTMVLLLVLRDPTWLV